MREGSGEKIPKGQTKALCESDHRWFCEAVGNPKVREALRIPAPFKEVP
jgi:hypothetical protein